MDEDGGILAIFIAWKVQSQEVQSEAIRGQSTLCDNCGLVTQHYRT